MVGIETAYVQAEYNEKGMHFDVFGECFWIMKLLVYVVNSVGFCNPCQNSEINFAQKSFIVEKVISFA